MKFIRMIITPRGIGTYRKFAQFIMQEYRVESVDIHLPYIDIEVATENANSVIHCGMAYDLMLRQEIVH